MSAVAELRGLRNALRCHSHPHSRMRKVRHSVPLHLISCCCQYAILMHRLVFSTQLVGIQCTALCSSMFVFAALPKSEPASSPQMPPPAAASSYGGTPDFSKNATSCGRFHHPAGCQCHVKHKMVNASMIHANKRSPIGNNPLVKKEEPVGPPM